MSALTDEKLKAIHNAAALLGENPLRAVADAAIAADRAARAEPVGFIDANGDLIPKIRLQPWTKLYTAPPAAPVVPDGMVLVPVEPTPEIVQAGYDASWDGDVTDHEMFAGVYRAMLDAAPAASQGNKAVAEAAVSEDRASRGGPIGKLRVREGLNGKSAHFGELEVSTLPDGVYPLYIIPPAVTEPLTSGVYTEQTLTIADMVEAALKASRVELVPGTTNWAYFMIQYLSKTKEAYSDK